MRQAVLSVILLSCFYYGSSANLIQQFKADSCEEEYLPKPPCCGIGKESAARIVGGIKANINEFPWMVNLGKCGGSLINSRWVLSAAHCFEKDPPDTAYFGARNCYFGTCFTYEKKIKIIKSFIKEEYISRGIHDIALLQLQEPVTFSDVIKPVCLPTSTDQHLDGREAIVSGWGATTTDNASFDLLKTTIEIWSPERCKNFNGYEVRLNSKYQICAGGKSNSACFGDSGGPLFLKLNDKKNNRSYYQVGIVSGGPDPCGKKGYPQFYTNVAEYTKWIEHIISQNQED